MFSLEAELVRLSQDALKLEQKVTELFELLRGPIQRYLVTILGNAAEAEEATQETFLRLYQNLHSGQRIKNVRAWLFRVAHNLAIDRRRTSKSLDIMDASYAAQLLTGSQHLGSSPERRVLDQERLGRVQSGLAGLSAQERHCMDLRAEGLRYREIADILGISPSSVAEFLRRAINKLMRALNA
jgi:RNA polymerase sigma-70 factor (ECF subfamily)